jgi:D-ribose pyranase
VRRDGLWHPRVLSILAAVGHGDLMVIADAGLPVPRGVETDDLVWRRGEPPFLPVVQTLLDERPVERGTVAAELSDEQLLDGLVALLDAIPIDAVAHEELKRMTGRGERRRPHGAVTPYPNLVLRCGVASAFEEPSLGEGNLELPTPDEREAARVVDRIELERRDH